MNLAKEALSVIPCLFNYSFDMLDGRSSGHYSDVQSGKRQLLFEVLQEFASQGDQPRNAKLRLHVTHECIKGLNARLIKLDDHAARAEPVSIGSTYTGMWGNSSPTFTPKQDPLLELFKAADESLRPYLTDTVRHLVNQYESVCSKPATRELSISTKLLLRKVCHSHEQSRVAWLFYGPHQTGASHICYQGSPEEPAQTAGGY